MRKFKLLISRFTVSPKSVRAAQNLNTPPQTLTQLANSFRSPIYRWVARNPSTPAEVLAKLARKPQFYIRELIAANPSTSPEVLAKLAKNKGIRLTVASNPNISLETLRELTKFPKCLSNISRNPASSAELLESVYEKGSPDPEIVFWIHKRLASNPKTSLKILTTMMESQPTTSRIAEIREAVSLNPTYLQHRAVQDGVCAEGVLMPVEWLKEMYLNNHQKKLFKIRQNQ